MPAPLREEERKWHDELYSTRSAQELVLPEKIKLRYLSPPSRPFFPMELTFQLMGDVRGKKVLCCGCGDENSTVLLAMKGADVWAVDLSPEAVQIQRRLASANGVEDRVHPLVCAAEELPFAAGSFDIIFGAAILHHLPDALPKISEELSRVLKDDGVAVFSEPFANSPFLRWLRRIVPVALHVSPRERQLVAGDLDAFRRYFLVELFPFRLLSRLDRFLLHGPLEYASAWRRAGIYLLCGLDHMLLRLRPLHRYASILVMKLRPKTVPARTEPS